MGAPRRPPAASCSPLFQVVVVVVVVFARHHALCKRRRQGAASCVVAAANTTAIAVCAAWRGAVGAGAAGGGAGGGGRKARPLAPALGSRGGCSCPGFGPSGGEEVPQRVSPCVDTRGPPRKTSCGGGRYVNGNDSSSSNGGGGGGSISSRDLRACCYLPSSAGAPVPGLVPCLPGSIDRRRTAIATQRRARRTHFYQWQHRRHLRHPFSTNETNLRAHRPQRSLKRPTRGAALLPNRNAAACNEFGCSCIAAVSSTGAVVE
mmetsp:Transcript_74522/g.145617  ORF Transcript_74522/g.145617 Transcript_74522/m.145617 type:complete len:262 (+) Transcript_74522:301-1086(+)